MARTGQTQAADASKATSAQQSQAFAGNQASIGQYNKNIATLDSGGNVGANPFMDPAYLANISKLRAGTLDAQNDAGKTQLEDLNTRTGGLGSSATRYGISNLALQKMRLGDQLGSQQAASDYGRNLDWQQYLASAPLQAANAEEGVYGTATSGNSAANSNLSQFGLASYGPWNSLIGAAGGAAAGALGPGGAATKALGCWIAESIYGVDDPRTILVRLWLNTEFIKTKLGKAVMAVYLSIGQQVAWFSRRSGLLRSILRPLFDKALLKAKEWEAR